MKHLLLLLLTLFCLSSYGQNKSTLLGILPEVDGVVVYTGVVNVDSATKSQLYDRLKRWFISSYHSGKDVIQLDDKENGQVIGKGYFDTQWKYNFMYSTNVEVYETVDIQVKDGKFKYKISDFRLKYSTGTGSLAQNVETAIEQWIGLDREDNAKKYLPQINDNVNKLIATLTSALSKASAVKEEW